MHGSIKRNGELQAAELLKQQKPDTPDFIGPDWWLYKAMHDPAGAEANHNLSFFTMKYHESNRPAGV